MSNLFGAEFENKEPTNDPSYARAKELFLQVDEHGVGVYTLEEIRDTLKNEGFESISTSKLSRLSNAWKWKEKRDALIRNALINQELDKAGDVDTDSALGSVINMAEYIKKTGKINQDGLDVLGKWIDGLKAKPSISDKEAAVATKVVEATGKMYEEILKKIGEKDNAKATASEVLKLLKKENGIVDVEILS